MFSFDCKLDWGSNVCTVSRSPEVPDWKSITNLESINKSVSSCDFSLLSREYWCITNKCMRNQLSLVFLKNERNYISILSLIICENFTRIYDPLLSDMRLLLHFLLDVVLKEKDCNEVDHRVLPNFVLLGFSSSFHACSAPNYHQPD